MEWKAKLKLSYNFQLNFITLFIRPLGFFFGWQGVIQRTSMAVYAYVFAYARASASRGRMCTSAFTHHRLIILLHCLAFRLASVCFSVDSGSGNSAYKVKRAREKVLINKINCRESVLEKQTSSKRCYSRFGFNLISGSVPSKKRECKMNGHGEFFLPFSSPKTAFLQVMDTNKKIITHRKRWRREDFSLCDELN